LDTEFLALSFAFILIGVTGIVLFNGPMTPAGDSCYCIIPSPEPGAAQGTASIILAFGILFLPIGILKGGFSLRGRQAVAGVPLPQTGRAYTPIQIRSGGLFSFGILLVLIGLDALLVPGVLLFRSADITAAGAIVTILGAIAVYYGTRPKSGQP